MKKVVLCALVLVSGLCFSCKGENKEKEAIPDVERVEMTPNEVVEIPRYKIEEGRIIPTDGKPMIVDFSATWCPPCRQLKPIFEKLAEDFRGRISFVTIDVDENPELSQAYGVQSIPMMVFLNKDGQIQDTIIGFQDRDQLLAAINAYFGF
ncbi:MAG: thioredoxin fold domain-containing protein [Muribaculaceae bacterium]|nr:thioredoxin fold domain-containing protein [Muribaculaceae bacterium]